MQQRLSWDPLGGGRRKGKGTVGDWDSESWGVRDRAPRHEVPILIEYFVQVLVTGTLLYHMM